MFLLGRGSQPHDAASSVPPGAARYTAPMRRMQRHPADDVNEAHEAPLAEPADPAPASDPGRVPSAAHANRPADPIDELIGWLTDIDPVDDIDAIVYELEA